MAAAAAAVSFTAQYRMVDATRHLAVIAALEAAIPDAALVFACFGIAPTLHGRRALRARTLNLASVAASAFMNAIAANPAGGTWPSGPCPPSPTPWPATPSTASSAPGPSPSTTSTPPGPEPGQRRGQDEDGPAPRL